MKKVLITFAVCICMCGNVFAFELLDNINKAGEIGTEVEQLKKENELLKKEVESLKVEIKSIKDFLELQKIMNNYYDRSIKTLDFKLPEQALLNPSESKFSIISCRGGLFTVSCENIRKYSTCLLYTSASCALAVLAVGKRVRLSDPLPAQPRTRFPTASTAGHSSLPLI